MAVDTIDAQLDEVKTRFPDARLEQTPDGQRVLVVPSMPTSSGWNMAAVTLRVIVPVGYPQVQPDSFCADAQLALASGVDPNPKNSQVQAILGGQYRWFSWHLPSWDPVNGTLDQYVRFCEQRLRNPQ